MTQKFPVIGTLILKIFFLATILNFAPVALSAETKREPWQVWETHIEPVAKQFPSLESVYLILALRNVSQEIQEPGLPYQEDQPWFQWIEIYHQGKRLKPKVDHDFAYLLGSVRQGEQLSLLVALEKFYETPAKSEKGKYELVWQGGTLGGAKTVRAEFEIDPKMKSPADIFSLSTYLQAGETKTELWKRILASHSDPKWITLFRILPSDYIDPPSLIQLVRTSNDVGIRREALRALGRVGKDIEVENLLIKFLRDQKDKPLIEFAVLSLDRLRGRTD